MRFLTSGFFMNQFPQGHFKFFRKFPEIFAAQGAPPVANGKNLQSEKFKLFLDTFG
jgi:hypothetical protein